MRSETANQTFTICGRMLVVGCLLALTAGFAFAQRGPARGKLEGLRDPELEASSKHDLEVARWYLTKRKAYEGARDRLQEIVDTYPDFSKIDEVIYLLGEVNHKMGKDAEAAKFYNDIIKNYPGSQFFKKAKEQLAGLKIDEPAAGSDTAGPAGAAHPAPPENPKKPTDNSKDKHDSKSGPQSADPGRRSDR